ncbi:hypothetical protein Tco_0012480 [Tanacetum coccineum]
MVGTGRPQRLTLAFLLLTSNDLRRYLRFLISHIVLLRRCPFVISLSEAGSVVLDRELLWQLSVSLWLLRFHVLYSRKASSEIGLPGSCKTGFFLSVSSRRTWAG